MFILLETPANKSSIFEIKMPIFTENNPVSFIYFESFIKALLNNFISFKIPTIKSYMEQFPFPFYVVLKDVNNLPTIIGEALKDWFDMVARLESSFLICF